MKFSNEAMRDALLFFEENITYSKQEISEHRVKNTFNINNVINNEYFLNLFSKHKYTKDELYYTIEKMVEGNILNATGVQNSHYLLSIAVDAG